jgi:hypothetical protein
MSKVSEKAVVTYLKILSRHSAAETPSPPTTSFRLCIKVKRVISLPKHDAITAWSKAARTHSRLWHWLKVSVKIQSSSANTPGERVLCEP